MPRRAPRLADALGKTFLFVQAINLHTFEISARDDTPDSAVFDHRDVAKAPVAHDAQRIDSSLVRINRQRILRHRFRQREFRTLPSREHLHGIPACKNPYQVLMFIDDQHRADMALAHRLRSGLHGVTCVQHEWILISDDVS